MYYLRSRAAADAIKFTVDTSMLKVMMTVDYYNLSFHLFSLDNDIKSIFGNAG